MIDLLLMLAAPLQGPPDFKPPQTVPPVLRAQPRYAPFALPPELRVVASEPELEGAGRVLAEHLERLTGLDASSVPGPAKSGDIILTTGYLPDDLAGQPEAYYIEVGSDHVALSGGSPAGVHRAAARFLQLVAPGQEKGSWMLPPVQLVDAPASSWRGLMLDLARFPHSVEAVEEAIELAYLYSLSHVQLHLSDDQAFTFPASCLEPRTDASRTLPTRGYSRAQIARIVAFAADRGITLVPEIDMPAHASSLVRVRPDLFGTYDSATEQWTSTGVINMASPTALKALDELLQEVAEAFPNSPWIHLGGDEVWAPHLLKTSEFPAYAEAHGLPTDPGAGALDELLSHFLARMSKRVTELGRKPIVWEGFKQGSLETSRVPSSVTVMSWSQNSRSPEDLLADGHTIINCNWEPLYVVPAQGWASQPRHAWDWQPNVLRQRYGGKEVTLPGDAALLGSQICVWEQRPDAIVPSLLPLMPELATRMWGTGGNEPFADFAVKAERVKEIAARILRPVRIQAEGLASATGTLFKDRVEVAFDAPPGIEVQFRIQKGVNLRWESSIASWETWNGKPITLDENALVSARLATGGYTTRVRFQKGTPVLRYFASELPQGGNVDLEGLDRLWADGTALIGSGVLAAPDLGRMEAINRELFAQVRSRMPLRSHVDLRPLSFSVVAPGRTIDPVRPRLWGRHAVFAEGQIRIGNGGTWRVSGTARSGLARVRIGGQDALIARGTEEASASATLEPGVYPVTVELSVPSVHEDLQLVLQRDGAEGELALYDLLLPLTEHVEKAELRALEAPFR